MQQKAGEFHIDSLVGTSSNGHGVVCHCVMPMALSFWSGIKTYADPVNYHLSDALKYSSGSITSFHYCEHLNIVLVGWSNGLLDMFSISGPHLRTVSRPNPNHSPVVSIVTLRAHKCCIVVAAKENGCFESWIIDKYTHKHVQTTTVHHNQR